MNRTATMIKHLAALFMLTTMIAGEPMAVTSNDNLSVSAEIPPQVMITSGILDFGNATDPRRQLTASGRFNVTMTSGYHYHISLDSGLHFSSQRRMSDAVGHFRPYHLYQDAGTTILWGDSGYAGTYAAGKAKASFAMGVTQAFTVYGISAGQPRAINPPGSYSDTITITIHY